MLINIDVNRLDFTSSIFLIDNHFGSDRVCVCVFLLAIGNNI